MINNSASTNFFYAHDFIKYLDTILFVRGKLSEQRRVWLKKYYRKFILFNYLRYSKKYSKVELGDISKRVKLILNRP